MMRLTMAAKAGLAGAVLGIPGLAGCAGGPAAWERAGISETQRGADVARCQDQARTGNAAIGGTPAGQVSAAAPLPGRDPAFGLKQIDAEARAQARSYDRCMATQGYRRAV